MQAVSDLSFTLRRGETLGVVGESGSGKSVTSLAIMGLLNRGNADITGEVLFEGTDLLALTPEELREDPRPRRLDDLPGPVRLPAPDVPRRRPDRRGRPGARDVSKKEAWARAVELLGAVGIPNAELRARDYPHQFSGGMRQRAMIAMALVHNPDVLIADEPTTALDVTVQAQIIELIDRVKSEFDIGVILITHDLGVVAETATHVMVMYAGRAMEYGPAQEMFTAAQHPYAWGLLESMPTVEKRLDVLVPIEGSPPSLLNPPSGCPFHPRCAYRFEPCDSKLPPFASIPGGHLDACLLPAERKGELWKNRIAVELGVT